MFQRAKNSTRNPAVLENTSDQWGFDNKVTLAPPINKSMGRVPNAKNPIIKAPCRALPDKRANVCAVMVKPQGRKKVKAPITNGMYFPLKLFSLAIPRVMNLGM